MSVTVYHISSCCPTTHVCGGGSWTTHAIQLSASRCQQVYDNAGSTWHRQWTRCYDSCTSCSRWAQVLFLARYLSATCYYLFIHFSTIIYIDLFMIMNWLIYLLIHIYLLIYYLLFILFASLFIIYLYIYLFIYLFIDLLVVYLLLVIVYFFLFIVYCLFYLLFIY